MNELTPSANGSLDNRLLLNALVAFRDGDFSVRLPLDLTGVDGKIADAFNEAAVKSERIVREVARVSRIVGKEGKINQRVAVKGAEGQWAANVESINALIDDLVWPTSEMARVIGAVAKGDLSQTMSLEAESRPLAGEFLRTAKVVNGMVEQLSDFTSEVTRVAREVGTEGKLGGQAKVKGVSGIWKDLTDNVNSMAANLTGQVRNIADVTVAVANGDLSRKITVDVRGEFLQLKETINTMVEQLRSFASEVTRVAREVGTDGKLGGQAVVPGVGGVWKELTDNVNGMAANLTGQVRNIADVTTAVARGDLSRKITAEARGEILELKNTINIMVDQLSAFASEVTRVAREVGTEGKLGGQAGVAGVAGVWKDLTDNVNLMASNLTDQVRNIAEVTIAVANGDLSKKVTVDVRGEFLQLKETMNTMLEQLRSFASEVTRVAREVGTEGKLGGQAVVPGVAGTWKDLTDNVNLMGSNLTGQVRNIAEVATAIANGDLSRKITVDVKGEILELKDTINTMVDQLNAFGSEVTRVAREVGTEGKLGGQAVVPGVAGAWKDLTDNVNLMAGSLTAQVRNIAEVATAIARGDLSRKITVDVKGEILELKNTINVMVDQLNSFAGEVTRVAREVGTEGKLGGQAEVTGVSGTWKDLTDNVNLMAGNLTVQLRDVSKVATAIARGDLTQKITVDVKGEILQIKDTINTMVDQLNSFGSEVTRVAREVGTEGKLGGQAEVTGVSGTWKDLTDNVNLMANNLTAQVRNIALVTTAVANGDLSKKITADARGEILELKDTINVMVDQLNAFAEEVTRVAREVGTDGKLGGQADVKGVSGTWKDLTDNVNGMANNLTGQVRNIAEVTTAVARGDLTRKITVDARGEILELKNTVNAMVDRLNSFAAEVTRVAREVGTDGKLGGQADVRDVVGVWKDLTDSVNGMANNLTNQVRNIAQVTTAIARGDLSQKITADARGELLELKNTINIMVDQLNGFAGEVTRVAREVGTDGKLGGQATVKGVSGTWKDLTDSVNSMASSLTAQVRNIAQVTTAVARGDLSQKITVDVKGEILELKVTVNTMVDQLNSFAAEVTRVARQVGTEGRLGVQAEVRGVGGTWKDLTDNVNLMASNLTNQVRNIAEVTTAVANGDLSKKITVDAFGEILELKNTINVMVDQLNSFASEVTRVAREVGTEGKLGGQAVVKGVSGTWKDLTDNVNLMANNLTDQVRGIAKVVTAIASGNLKQKLQLTAKGEIAALAETINSMTDTLATFAVQVTGVAREVGVEGRLGGQADVPGAAGTWKDLTDNVNQLAANLTNQVRAIAEVATAVTRGDLSRRVTVEAKGEVSELKDNINEMIRNLRETTQQNQEQDWLKTNLAKFTRMLQGQRDMTTVSRTLLSELSPLVGVAHGVFYLLESGTAQTPGGDGKSQLKMLASYGFKERKNISSAWRLGEGLVGQAAFEKQRILLTNVPADYVQITSGLGQAGPLNIIILPVLFEGEVKAVIELAAFERFSAIHQNFLEQLTESIGIVLNTIEAGSRTEDLLKESQTLAEQLQSQQEELQQTNEELEEKARLLSQQNAEVERKNREIEVARKDLEEKAAQLALTSKYKSEFLANMSHELRTPLNSLLILSQQLGENPEGNLSEKQVEFSRIIHASGNDLLNLINDILDLSKIESGTTAVEVEAVNFSIIRDAAERTFRPVGIQKKLGFDIALDPSLPPTIHTDSKRLQQIIKNLLSNAFKFTEKGAIELGIAPATEGWSRDQDILNRARLVIAFMVRDTGIGIPADKQKIIFEAFQQADGSTGRKYGGTGLGLAISRELAYLLGGDLLVMSTPGVGSTFTLYLPQSYAGPHLPFGRKARGEDSKPPIEDLGFQRRGSRVKAPSSTTPSEASSNIAVRLTAEVNDDRAAIQSGDQVLLIVEDDLTFAGILADMARKRGFKPVITARGDEAMMLVREYKPAAITLDICLVDIDGWTVLDRIKTDPGTRHIPVHVITVEDDRLHGLEHGAFAFMKKPVNQQQLAEAFTRIQAITGSSRTGRLLLVEDNEGERQAIMELIGNGDVTIKPAASGQEALDALKAEHFDCMVLDLKLPDISGFQVLEAMQQDPALSDIPVIVYTGRDLNKREEAKLQKIAQSVIVKGIRSPERLLAETALFLHRVVANLPENKRRTIEALYQSDTALTGKKALLVDDDMRNIFALTNVLERHQITVLCAENGREALEQLQQVPDIDIVLMDIMMPGMDGYETINAIRKNPRFKRLPIIALTAKAMKGDREKCLEAGASDYIAKPVNTAQLLSLMRVWLYR